VGQVGIWTCEKRLEGNTKRMLCRAWEMKYGRELGAVADSEIMEDGIGAMGSSELCLTPTREYGVPS
jgi:hypothetical protein